MKRTYGTEAQWKIVVLGSSLTALALVRVAYRSGFKAALLDDRDGPAARTRVASFRRLVASDEGTMVGDISAELTDGATALVADSDRWLRFLVRHEQDLSRRGFTVLHPEPSAIETCLDKSAFLTWCARHGLPAPRLYEVGSASTLDEVSFPALLRPEATQHSVRTGLPKARKIRDRVELEQWLRRFEAAGVRPAVCESLLRPGLRQFSIGAARNRRGHVKTFLAEKVRPRAERCEGGTFVRPAQMAAIEDLAAVALNQLDFFGMAEVEVLYDPASGRASLVEINARPWLQYALPYACGCDLLGHVLEARSQRLGKSSLRHAWIHSWPDLVQCFSRSSGMYREGTLTVSEYVRTALSADVHAVWDWSDPNPFISSVTQLLANSVQRLRRPRRADERAPRPASGETKP